MKLLGHTSPEMTMRYLDVALTDLQREFQLARSKPRHLAPQPRTPFSPRAGLDGVIDSLLAAQHVLEMFRRTLPNGTPRRRLDRLSNRLTKIVTEARNLADTSLPRGSDATLARVGTLSEGSRTVRYLAALPRSVRSMGRTV
jgi:hypothetical protein